MNQEQNNQKFSTPAAIVLGAVIIALAVIWALHPSSPSAANQPTPSVNINNVKVAGEPFVGNANAPITIAYFFDYQCPFCKQDEETVIPQLMTDYVNTGKVKIVFKDFPFLGPDSLTLSTAARAVWDVEPDKFYEWHKAVYDAQGEEGSGWATQTEIMKITTDVLGATDAAQVANLMTVNAAKYAAEIAADKTEGDSLGVQGTPAMIIGTQLLVGAEPYSAIQSAIAAAAKSQ
ncbi:MAG TPA: thioredoxin domain-containing protein [Candidatus Paceibacterota bacterium]|nr:thioredoxin domain-containing protein [Candidatus Paceibacterota bacterium]